MLRALFHLLQGLILGYPPYCILHFCYDELKGIDSSAERGITKSGYVPCKWCVHENIIRKFPIERKDLKEYLDKGYGVSRKIRPNGDVELFIEILIK